MILDVKQIPVGTKLDAKKVVELIDIEIAGLRYCSDIANEEGNYKMRYSYDTREREMCNLRTLFLKRIEEGRLA